MYYTVKVFKNSSTIDIRIIECDEEILINLDDPDIKLLNVDNIQNPNIIGVANINYQDLFINKKPYEISYYNTYFDYNDAYFFGLTFEKALELEEQIRKKLF